MTRAHRFTVSLLIWVIVVTTLMTACSSKSAILGKWERLPLPTPIPGGDDLGLVKLFSGLGELFLPKTLEFFDDGKYAGDPMSFLPGGEYEIVDKNRIRLSSAQGLIVLTFSIEGNILTLTDENGASMQFRRVK